MVKHGIHPTEETVKVIRDAPRPGNVRQLQAFLGLINYYGKFIPQAATQLTPLYKLLEKNSTWHWSDECNAVFQECKLLLTSKAVLAHYNTNKPLRFSYDTSQYG